MIPDAGLKYMVQWYHVALGHMGHQRLIATMSTHLCHPRLIYHCRQFVQTCDACQRYKNPGRGYGPRQAPLLPFSDIAVDLNLLLQQNRQTLIDYNVLQENNRRIRHDYAINDLVLEIMPLVLEIMPEDKGPKMGIRMKGPYRILRVHTNGTLSIERSQGVEKRVNIRYFKPYRN
jgi:hypothetical protein